MGVNLHKIELTSPAGNIEKGRFALLYGANSVYIGYPGLSLRTGAEKFSYDDITTLISFAHQFNKKVYLAINIFAHNKHLLKYEKELKQIEKLAPDGLILSDPGLIDITKQKLPGMHITVSTQANTSNYAMVNFWEKIGANRVVLARELSLDEIKQIRDKTNLELEIFVHGAMCVAYSGRCLLSGFLTSAQQGMTHHNFQNSDARHGNLGSCAQPCRWNFALVEENRRDFAFPISEDQWGTYILSAKDLCLIDYVKDLALAGIDVFKIEGRMKSIYYVANVTRVYRKALDLLLENKTLNKKHKKELDYVSHRGYSTGFTIPSSGSTGVSHAGYIKTYRFYAHVKECQEKPMYALKVYNTINDHKEIEVIGPNMKNRVIKPEEYTLYDHNKNKVDKIRHQFDGYIKTNFELNKNDIIRIKIKS